MISLPIALFAAVAAALLSRRIRSLWVRMLLVVVVAYGAAFLSMAVALKVARGEAQFASLLVNISFAVGAVVGIVVLIVSHWLLKPRRPPHAG